MEISRSTSSLNLSHFFAENLPCAASDAIFDNEHTTTVNNRDPLEAVKLDPAVLEAKVTLKTSSGPVFTASDHGHRNDSSRASSESSSNKSDFEEMVDLQQAALLSLTPHQFDLIMKFVDTLRKQRLAYQLNLECAFCKANGEPVGWYSSHALKNWRGSVQCPVLRAYRCRRCGATGDRAHTIKYCPENNDGDSQLRRLYRNHNN